MCAALRHLTTALALWTGACAVAQGAPIEVRDALGRTVVLPAPPQRLVTIFASNTELVTSLGLVDRIVGVEEYTRFPPEAAAKPKVGGRLGFSVDAVVAQRPDLVIVTPARQAAHQLVDPMERLGVPVIVLLSRSVGEVLDNIRLVGRATGVPERGDALAEALQVRLDRVAQQVAGQSAPRIVMVTGRVGNGMLLVARSDTYTGEAMVLAGGRFAIAGRGAVAQVSPEAILASDPDVLLFAGTKAALDDLVRLPGWRDMRAVRAQRAVTVSRSEFLIPGPRTIDGIESLARWLHPAKAQP
jgi:iron complex transport system substrate-binding protein